MTIALDAARATNLYGPLVPELRARIDALIEDPTPATWDDAYTIIVNGDTFTSLWQAVLHVDPSFPARINNGTWRWQTAPTREVVLAALHAAVNGEVTR